MTVLYETVTNSIPVSEIAEPVYATDSVDATMQALWEEVSEGQIENPLWSEIVAVRERGSIIGWVDFFADFETESMGDSVRDHLDHIPPSQLIPHSMPLLDLLSLFDEHPFFFVLTRNAITHVVTRHDVDKLPMKLCMFALFMELEVSMINALMCDPLGVRDHLKRLSAARAEKAAALFEMKHARVTRDQSRMPSPNELLLCTTFIDKVTMIQRSPTLYRLLPFETSQQRKSFFLTIEKLRNQVAHSDSMLKVVPDPGDLGRVVLQARAVIESLSALAE